MFIKFRQRSASRRSNQKRMHVAQVWFGLDEM